VLERKVRQASFVKAHDLAPAEQVKNAQVPLRQLP
jgi:hypothetical protein